jgi:hypothetical protein
MYPGRPVIQHERIDDQTYLITCVNGIEQDDEVICFMAWLIRHIRSKIRGDKSPIITTITIYTQDKYDFDAHDTLSVFGRTRHFFRRTGNIPLIEQIDTLEKLAICKGGAIAFSKPVDTDAERMAARAARFASGSLGGAIVIDYKKKYLKYKEKYLSLKINIHKNK